MLCITTVLGSTVWKLQYRKSWLCICRTQNLQNFHAATDTFVQLTSDFLHLNTVASVFLAPYAHTSTGNRRRPIYNVAHMVNGKSQINAQWVNEANAIESDLAFRDDGYPDKFYHGVPCDCGRECTYKDDVTAHFDTIRRKALRDKTFGLFWLDLKLGKMKDYMFSGRQLAIEITKRGSLFPPGEIVPKINVLLGAQELGQKNFFRGFRQYIQENRPELLHKFGYDFSNQNLKIDDILATFEELGIRENIWMGDGITNCFTRNNERLIKILQRRDSNSPQLAPSKVYAWTADKTSTMRTWLQLGVDAIIVNYPNRLKYLVNNQFKNSLVLADQNTNPWERIKAAEVVPPLAHGCSTYIVKKYCWKYTTPHNWCWSYSRCNTDNDCYGNFRC